MTFRIKLVARALKCAGSSVAYCRTVLLHPPIRMWLGQTSAALQPSCGHFVDYVKKLSTSETVVAHSAPAEKLTPMGR